MTCLTALTLGTSHCYDLSQTCCDLSKARLRSIHKQIQTVTCLIALALGTFHCCDMSQTYCDLSVVGSDGTDIRIRIRKHPHLNFTSASASAMKMVRMRMSGLRQSSATIQTAHVNNCTCK